MAKPEQDRNPVYLHLTLSGFVTLVQNSRLLITKLCIKLKNIFFRIFKRIMNKTFI